MTLGEARRAFSKCVPRLIDKAVEMGYEPQIEEVVRSQVQAALNTYGEEQRQAIASTLGEHGWGTMAMAVERYVHGGRGILMSVHVLGLAVDVSLIKDGKLVEEGEVYRELGEYWKGLHPLARAGADFGDEDHFSFEWGGRK